MTTPQRVEAPPPSDGDQLPWYDLIPEVPEPPEDGMQQDPLINFVSTILRTRYWHDPSVLIAGPQANLIYDSAVPGSFVVPDCFIVFGIDAARILLERRSYRIQEWGQVPSFVLEVASESTKDNDLGQKRLIYAQMGAQEYWRLDDRLGEYYREPLVGETLVDGEYQRIELHREDNGDVWSRSDVLGVDFYHQADSGFGKFLLRDSATGEWLNYLPEEREARLAAEASARDAEVRAQDSETRARDSELRNRELEAELDLLRRQQHGDTSNNS